MGEDENDHTALIGFNHSSETLFPGNSCILYKNGEYSDILVLKEGEGNMDMTNSDTERWGDFTTMQLKHNENNKAYFTGSFGRNNNTRTQVSIISLEDEQNDNTITHKLEQQNVFPNPAYDIVNVDFYIENPQICSFMLYDSNGKFIDEIFTKKTKKGNNRFSFNISHLNKGVYILIIKGSENFKTEQKIIVLP